MRGIYRAGLPAIFSSKSISEQQLPDGGAMRMSAAVFAQAGRPVLLETTQPFAHRGHRGGKGSSGRFNPVLTGVLR